VANFAFRRRLDLDHSAATDAMVALSVFDFVVITEPNRFKQIMAIPIQEDIFPIYAFLMVFTILSWISLLLFAEKSIVTYNRWLYVNKSCNQTCVLKDSLRETRFPGRAYLLSFLFPMVSGGGTLSTFLYRG
jgi:hypothetical protein